MRPEELVLDILRRWWIVVLAVLAAAAAGYGVAARQTDEYTASVRLVATAEPADYWLDQYAKARLTVYATLIDNYTFVQQAMESARLPFDPSYAQSRLSVSHASNTNTLTITVTDTDPSRAAEVANAVAVGFVAWNDEENASLVARATSDEDPFPARVVLTPLEPAGAPGAPSGPSARSTAAAAGLIGAVAGFVIVFLLMYRDDTMKTQADVERYLGQPVLARIPARSAAARGFENR